MPFRPSRVWKDLPPDRRLAAADAFWRDDRTADVAAQHYEAIFAIAKRLNFRAKTVQTLPLERRARQLAQLGDVSDTVASRALIAYHLAAQRPMMSAFLDALGIAHDQGLITAETVPPPDAARLAPAVAALRQAFPSVDVDLYLRTLVAMDADTWGQLEGTPGF
jgi:hypothetical protein